jgi:hypothetical protein
MRVSIVAVRCRRLAHAARWKGQAPQRTTGVASARASHCHRSNCQAGTIDRATSGTVRTAETASRARSPSVSSPSSPSATPVGTATRAVYPAASTSATSRVGSTTPGGALTWARSVA